MRKRSKNILSLLVVAGTLTVLSAFSVHADERICKVTFQNNSDEYAVLLADKVNYGVVYPKRWNTFSMLKVNYQGQPYHMEIQVDVNKNGNPVTVKEEYVDLSNRDEYTLTYP